MSSQSGGGVPVSVAFGTDWFPEQHVEPPENLEQVLDEVLITSYQGPGENFDPGKSVELGLSVRDELTFGLPGFGAVDVVVGGPGKTALTVGTDVDLDAGTTEGSVSGSVSLRFPREWLRPVERDGDSWVDHPTKEYAEIDVGAGVTVDRDLNVSFDATNEFSLGPAMIADSGFVVEGTVSLDLSKNESIAASQGLSLPGGQSVSESWQGVVFTDTTLHFPESMDVPAANVAVQDFHIGTGGITGTVSLTGSMPAPDASDARELFGMPYRITELDVQFVQTTLARAAIEAEMQLPFFEDVVALDLGVTMDGGVTATLSSTQDALQTVEKEHFRLELDRLGFELEDGVPAVLVGGTIEPRPENTSTDLSLPGIDVQELRIDAEGDVRVPGGWIELGDQYKATVAGFGFEITKFGLGKTDDGGRWVGFSGGVELLTGLPAGVSVDGLRFEWGGKSGTDVSFDGVGVEFEVPEAVKFKGEVSLEDDEFRGEIDLELLALDMTIDAEVVFGTTAQNGETFDYMGIRLDANLPAGIPLWSTGLSLYGFGGLFANRLEPDKGDDQQWFAVSGKPAESWFHEDPQGVMGLKKWRPAADAMGFGASVDLATAPDNGLSVATDLALVMSFPGPTIVLQGRAELLEEGAAVGADAPYQALMVLDDRAGSVTLGVDAHYENTPLLDISADAEAFYSLSDPRAWYLHLGQKDPREDRIRAEALSVFTAEAYLMLDNDRLATGIWAGYDESWKFGPLNVAFVAAVSSDVLMNFQPVHLYGTVQFHGEVSLSAFGVGVGASIHADVEADVFDPFHMLGKFSVSLNLPWPLPDPSATVTLEWGPDPDMPEIPDPLEQVGIGHEKLASTWQGETGPEQVATSRSALSRPTDAPAGDAPVVPMDARPEVTFARPVHDASGVTENPSAPAPPYEVVGDPAKNEGPLEVRYELSAVNLLAWDPDSGTWVEAADVSGTWAPMPAGGSGDTAAGAAKPMTQTKLQVSTRTPYHYSRRAGGAWEDAIDWHFPRYPCPAEHYCYEFDDLDDDDFEEEPLASGNESWHRYQRTTHAQEPWARFLLRDEGIRTPSVAIGPTTGPDGSERAFIVRERDRDREAEHEEAEEYPHALQIYLPRQLRSVRLRLRSLKHPTSGEVRAYDVDDEEQTTNSWSMDGGQDRTVAFTGDDAELRSLELDFDGSLAVVEVCSASVDLSTPGIDLDAGVEETRAQLARWSDEGEVLEPYTDYRMEIVTTAHARGVGDFSGHDETSVRAEYVAFRTAGPPGLSTPDRPVGSEKAATGLETLARYVHQTDPETVPAEGEQPPLPRPVYRADPAGVDFDVDYVDLLYRLANRDLALYLYDTNDDPVRDARGRLVVEENQWGETESLLLDRATRRWFARLDASPCLDLDDFDVERTKRLATGEDRVLEPDAVHEARLRPLLYRETWADGTAGWTAVTEGTTSGTWTVSGHGRVTGNDATWLADGRVQFGDGGFVADLDPHRDTITFSWSDQSETFSIVGTTPASNEVTLDREPGSLVGASYEVPARHDLRQTTSVDGVSGDAGTFYAFVNNPDLPANDDDQPTEWTDVRVSATLGTDGGTPGVVGLVVRRQGSTYYRVELDAADTCRLGRIEGGSVAAVWTADGGYHPGLDVTLTVEAIGDEIQVLVDGDPVLRVVDPDGPDVGTVGPYCRGTAGFRCGDVRVDDFRAGAPIAYRFSVTTSKFVDAVHQVHSYDDEVWRGTLPTTDRPVPADRADPAIAPTPEEHRTYRQATDDVAGAGQLPDQFEVTRLTDGTTSTGLFVRSPEPIDWTSTALSVERGPRFDAVPTPPGMVKLTALDFDTGTLSLLLRETGDVDGYTVEYRRAATGGFAPTPTATVFEESFASATALDAFDVVDPAGDATWSVDDREASAAAPSDWSAVVRQGVSAAEGVVETTVTVESGGRAGLVFRYRDPNLHYRLVVDEDGTRLVRITGGSETVLESSTAAATADEPTDLRLTISDGELAVETDDVRTFVVSDPQPGASGRVGIFADGEAAASTLAFHDGGVESVLLDAPFTSPDPADWTFVKEPPFSIRTPDWRFEADELRQVSNIYGFVGGRYAEPGTYAVTGDRSWTDYRTTVRLQSDDNDAIGVIVRYRDDDHYYRFSMDVEREYRRLVRKHGGETTLLWEQETGFDRGREYVVTVECLGDRLVGFLDGEQLFDVTDDAIDAGKVGLYCRANRGARFESLRVVAPADSWVPYHTFEADVPLAAGTRFEIVDAASVSDPVEPRRERRARNGSPVALPPTSAHFRVRTPAGDPTHARQFRHESAYAPVTNASVVRSADGTSLLVFDDGDLVEGQYRLRLVPDGDGQFDAPVTVDVPWDRS